MRVKIALTMFLIAALAATPAFAGWQITMTTPGLHDVMAQAQAAKPDAGPLPDLSAFDTFTLWLDGTHSKFTVKDGWAWGYYDYDSESFGLGLDAAKAKEVLLAIAASAGKKPTEEEQAQFPMPDPPKQAVSGNVDQFLSALGEALAPVVMMAQAAASNMTAEQRDKMKDQMKIQQTNPANDMSVKKRAESIPIAGCNTVGYDVSMQGHQVVTLWMCPAVNTDLIHEKSKKTNVKVGNFFKDLATKMSSGTGLSLPEGMFDFQKQQAVYDQMKGFPFEVNMVDPNTGKTTTMFQVTEAKQMKIPPTEFAVPAGYKITNVKDAMTSLEALIAQQMMKARSEAQAPPSEEKKKSHGHTIVMENNEVK